MGATADRLGCGQLGGSSGEPLRSTAGQWEAHGEQTGFSQHAPGLSQPGSSCEGSARHSAEDIKGKAMPGAAGALGVRWVTGCRPVDWDRATTR
ncbi:hypothetical protein AAFF_G00262310 [Aldrovandia affinis]|uniref:Uncharacterized protein n=1 Tax=Aldrovandia affinis TaxID=143900 RepID=A0AAD7STQ6_9TELE|nr:hypothetical protein AAFF_G00262310 [Aldrovandia affinis]